MWELSPLERILFAFLFSIQARKPARTTLNHNFRISLPRPLPIIIIVPIHHPLPHCQFQASSSTVFRTHFPYRDSDEDYLVLIGGCAPIDIGGFVDDDRAAVKDGQLLVDESSETSRRIRFGLWVFLLVCFYIVSQAFLHQMRAGLRPATVWSALDL